MATVAMIAMIHASVNIGKKSTNTKSITKNLEEEMVVAHKSRVLDPGPDLTLQETKGLVKKA